MADHGAGAQRCQLCSFAHHSEFWRPPFLSPSFSFFFLSFHMLIFTGHSRKWRWQPRFEVTSGPGVKHFLLTWKHIQAHLALGICSPLPQTICTCIIWGSSSPNKTHVLITFEGVMTSGPQPILIWFQSQGPESRLRFRPPLPLLLPARYLVADSTVPL